MYKKSIKQLRVGQLIKLKVIENNDATVIVSFNGDLMRVSNKTGQYFEEDDLIELVVKKINPLEFALSKNSGLNVWV